MANKTISRINVGGTDYDLADITARSYVKLGAYEQHTSSYTTNVNLSTRTWYGYNTLKAGFEFNFQDFKYRQYSGGSLTSWKDMTGGGSSWTGQTGCLFMATCNYNYKFKTKSTTPFRSQNAIAWGTTDWASLITATNYGSYSTYNMLHTLELNDELWNASNFLIEAPNTAIFANENHLYMSPRFWLSNYTNTAVKSNVATMEQTILRIIIIFRGKRTGT